MVKLILKRLISLPFVILSITFITFIVGYLAPGDPILNMMGQRHDVNTYNQLRHIYGLDLPWYQQYLNYLTQLAHGDLGLSFRFQGRPVWDLIGSGATVSLSIMRGAGRSTRTRCCTAVGGADDVPMPRG